MIVVKYELIEWFISNFMTYLVTYLLKSKKSRQTSQMLRPYLNSRKHAFSAHQSNISLYIPSVNT